VLNADDEVQFWAIYQKNSEWLFRQAFRMCLGHEADAQDAHQRAYLRVLEHWGTFGAVTDSQRHAWLARTLAREVLQIWREPHR
jgi:DNA-directed RNA polymerase specialized sigma24 family protein